MRLGFYGRISTTYGNDIEVPAVSAGLSVAALRRELARRSGYEDILDPIYRAAVNNVIVTEDHHVREGDRVDFLSPLSGG